MIVLLAVKRMIDDAVRRCVADLADDMEGIVNATAVRVGDAVAEALRDEPHDLDQSVPRLYSGRG